MWEDLLAAYLYGSAVMGGLRPDSDLDVMVVSRRPTNEAEKRDLVSGILGLSMNPRSVELTIAIESDVRPWRCPPRRDFQYGDWWRSEYERGNFQPWTSDSDPDLASLYQDGPSGKRGLGGSSCPDHLRAGAQTRLRQING
ncbi:MAG: nucleotidyltransferase domain-containing protein [Actinomycetota bacterium]